MFNPNHLPVLIFLFSSPCTDGYSASDEFYYSQFYKTWFNTVNSEVVNALDVGGPGAQFQKHLVPSNFNITTIDIEQRRGVDVKLESSISYPFSDNSFDFLTSANVLEHDEWPWESIVEHCRIVKPGSLIFHMAPFGWLFHRSPSDRFRYYPDAGYAFASYSRLRGCELHVVQTFIGDADKSQWHPWICVFQKGPSQNISKRMPMRWRKRGTHPPLLCNYENKQLYSVGVGSTIMGYNGGLSGGHCEQPSWYDLAKLKSTTVPPQILKCEKGRKKEKKVPLHYSSSQLQYLAQTADETPRSNFSRSEPQLLSTGTANPSLSHMEGIRNILSFFVGVLSTLAGFSIKSRISSNFRLMERRR